MSKRMTWKEACKICMEGWTKGAETGCSKWGMGFKDYRNYCPLCEKGYKLNDECECCADGQVKSRCPLSRVYDGCYNTAYKNWESTNMHYKLGSYKHKKNAKLFLAQLKEAIEKCGYRGE